MAKQKFNGMGDETFNEVEAIKIVEHKVESYVGNTNGVISLHLFDSGKAWTITTNHTKDDIANEKGSKEIKNFQIPKEEETIEG